MRCGSIVLADRHPGMLMGIHSLLTTKADALLMVADEVSLMEAVEKAIPDVVIMDLSFAVSGGINLVKRIKQCNPAIKMIILSMYKDPVVVNEIMQDGADGFVLKQRAVIDLIPAVREVCQGGRSVSIDSMGR
jgi:two-component system nitrate/nitrite response regulator NarL